MSIMYAFLASAPAAIYSARFCTDQTFYSSDTKFQSNLNTLLSSLVSNFSLPSNSGFHRASVDDIDGRFLYRDDVNAIVCHGCVAAAATNITRLCPNDTEFYIWYIECTLIYSNNTFNNDDEDEHHHRPHYCLASAIRCMTKTNRDASSTTTSIKP
ncbi:hypothetical protein LR48_Vigan09g070400 [Vigna angularis]|uniref:Gnk2-homologous domain-containing protein n=1 Tax=Phaseolus angularis TaxID=3914 RepID=A0A0L9VAF5_PHAAN|nr:cysteine-rich receptor-like protein kinase 7 [Vigna angularis]KOM52045.1 hypothetical protein LR48_Vigan09g070400 [Vigna angularis]